MVEAERLVTGLVQLRPVGAGGFQQCIGADDVGLDECRRAVDGAVDVGLGGQVHDGIRLEAAQRLAYRSLITDVGLQEAIARVVLDLAQRLQVAGVGQLVEVEHLMIGVVDQVTDQC